MLLLFLSLGSSQPSPPEWYTHLQSHTQYPEFTLNGQTYLGRVTKVYDGDTITAAIHLCNAYYRFSFRLEGIDTPEVSSGVVREFGARVRDHVRDLILGRIVKIRAGEMDKYGRPLARFYAWTSAGEEF
jgi:endonuclease YncB( thermonuclease family)